MKNLIEHAIRLTNQQYTVANKKAEKILVKYNEAWVKDRMLVEHEVMTDADSVLYEELCTSMENSMQIQQALRLK